jgi:hypothetical protein
LRELVDLFDVVVEANYAIFGDVGAETAAVDEVAEKSGSGEVLEVGARFGQPAERSRVRDDSLSLREVVRGVRHGNKKAAFAATSWFQISPLTDSNRRPLLTIEVWSGNHGQARVIATTEIPQTEGIRRKGVTARGRACPRLCSLHVPWGRAFATTSAQTTTLPFDVVRVPNARPA